MSNERVPLDDAMRMVFEINSLANATPATVSRAGILYINEEDIGWQPFVDSWIHKFESEKIQATLSTLFAENVDVILKTVLKNLKTIVPIRCINQVCFYASTHTHTHTHTDIPICRSKRCATSWRQ